MKELIVTKKLKNINPFKRFRFLVVGAVLFATSPISFAEDGQEGQEPLLNAPCITLTQPADTNDTANTSYTIRWTDSDPDDNAIISLYYDTDNQGEDGDLIVENIFEDDSANFYVWDTTQISEGEYTIYAIIDDGMNEPVVDYSGGKIRIIADSDNDGMPDHFEDQYVGQVMFEDHFDDGVLDPVWVKKRTEWEEVNGKLKTVPEILPNFDYGSSGRTSLITVHEGNTNWIDYSYEFVCSNTGVVPEFNPYGLPIGFKRSMGSSFRVKEQPASWNEPAETAYGFSIIISEVSGLEGDVGDWKLTGTDSTYIPEIGGGSSYEGTYYTFEKGNNSAINPDSEINHVRVLVKGNRMYAWINGIFIGEAEDPLNISPYGGISFSAAHETMAWYDDVIVREAGLNPNLPDSDLDYDNDGFTNLEEYQNGTNPFDPSNNTPPSIQIIQPDGTNDTANTSYTIQWIDSDLNDNAIVSLYYDTDNQGECGDLIVENIFEDDPANSYVWDTTQIPEGEYTIYAIIDDGVNPPITSYGTGPLTIDHNNFPVLNAIGSRSVDENGELTFTVSATDPDAGNVLTYSATNLPAGASFDPSTRTFNWTPTSQQTGIYSNLHFGVSDGKLSDSEEITITVGNINQIPVITEGDSIAVTMDENGSPAPFELTLNATDNDIEDVLTWDVSTQALHGSAGVSGTGAQKEISYIPESNFNGSDSFVVQVNDDNGGSDTITVNITINPHVIPPPSHFTSVYTGNPYNRMNFWITDATLEFLDMEVGDEIGIFDGEVCVGSATLTQPITEGAPLTVLASEDDNPSDGIINGFTSDHPITFVIWDHSAQKERRIIEVNYFTMTGDPVDPAPNFAGNSDCGVTLEGRIMLTQIIPLTKGWNTISSYIMPEDANLLNILQPLIEEGCLIKAIDEQGSTIIKFLNNWVNQIGNLKNTEGYKIKVTEHTQLELTGLPTDLPLTIPLSAGWNIFSYPAQTPQNAITLVQPLIDAGLLVKIIDEKGDTLIRFLGNWVNQIGNFEPGKGYLIKVNADTELIIDAPANSGTMMQASILYEKKNSFAAFAEIQTEPVHFTPVCEGNYYNRTSLWLTNATINGIDLEIGDEIGIFDGKACVGSGIVTQTITKQTFFTVKASEDDDPNNGGTNGFISGNAIIIKIWDNSSQKEITDVPTGYFDFASKNRIDAPKFIANEDYGAYIHHQIDDDGDRLSDQWEQSIIDANSTDAIKTLSDVTTEGDPDNDGISNFLEYAFDLNPTYSNRAELPIHSLTEESGTNYFKFEYRKRKDDSGLTYDVLISEDLASPSWLDIAEWNSNNPSLLVEKETPIYVNMQTELVKIRINTANRSQGFIKLKVQKK